MMMERRQCWRRLCVLLLLVQNRDTVVDAWKHTVARGGGDGGQLPTTTARIHGVDTTRVIIETTSAMEEMNLVEGSSSNDETQKQHDQQHSNEQQEEAVDDQHDNPNKNDGIETSSSISILQQQQQSEESTTSDEDSFSSVSDQINALRSKGKRLHDTGNFAQAAECFATGAKLLDPNDDEDYFTFKLHQALCCLKLNDNEAARDICTLLLNMETMPIVLRARALHRRAKAYLALDDREHALEDARSAAMFGDSKAVELYGKLMREEYRDGGSSEDGYDSASAFSPNLFESLLSKSRPSSGASTAEAVVDPMSSLFDMKNMFGDDSGASLAKSVLSSVSKRLDDEATQELLCGYLQGVEGPQLAQWAGMAGLPLNTEMATKLANFCKTITKQGIRRTVKTSRRLFYAARLIRKTFKVIGKYRNVLILSSILWWTSSAVSRPLPAKSISASSKATATTKAKTTRTSSGTKPVGLLKRRR